MALLVHLLLLEMKQQRLHPCGGLNEHLWQGRQKIGLAIIQRYVNM
jgi:hypothetical protein